MRAVLPILLLVVLALAGCTNNGSQTSTPTLSAEQMTPAGGKAMLAEAASTMPDKYGMALAISSGSAQLLSMNASFDNATGAGYAEFHGDPTAWPNATAQGGAQLAPFLKSGIVVYVSKDGSEYLANRTAFVFPPSNGTRSSSSLVPPPDQGPLGRFMSPVNGPFRDVLSQDNVTVKSVTPVTWKGHPAAQLLVETRQGDQTIAATVVLYTSPARLAHVESALPRDPKSPQDPFAGATATADLSYGDDVTIAPSNAATRALALLYRSDSRSFGASSSSGPVTWTFLRSGGVSASEAVVEVKDTSNRSSTSGAPGLDLADAPTKWTFALSDGSKTQDGITLAFHDLDQDGKVSAGDTLTVTLANDSAEPPTLVLKDTVTGTYVVPGVGAIVALALVALAALVFPSRRS